MSNILNYAQNIKESFELLPFHSVDSLILSWLSYFHIPADYQEAYAWKGIPLSELIPCFLVSPKEESPLQQSQELLTFLAQNPRFSRIRVMGYTRQTNTEEEKQFAAMTFRIHSRLAYVAFRGTDATFVGWKEDFNMAFQYPVPSQTAAAKYLALAASWVPGALQVGGHSKGGNLAVYAAAQSPEPVKERIEKIYSHDGPGFLAQVLSTPAFLSIQSRVEKTLPQSSLVGMLLEQQDNHRIVKSSQISLLQHDPLSWTVEGEDFCYMDHLTKSARFMDQTLSEWIGSLSPQEREVFVNTLYSLLSNTNIESLVQLKGNLLKIIPSMLLSFSALEPDTRKFVKKTFQDLISLAIKFAPEHFFLTSSQNPPSDH